MTSPVGVIGLNFAGYDLQRADLNVMFAITEGLDTLPTVRGGDQIIPFRTGRLPLRRVGDRRSVVATGWVAGAAPAPETSYRTYLDGLKKVLDPTGLPGLLVATLTDGTARWINARPANPALMGGEMIGYEMRPMSIEWEALDPYWYSSWGNLTLDTVNNLDEGDVLDSSAEMIITGAALVDVHVLGTADIERIRVRFVGPTVGTVGLATTGANPIGFAINRALTPFECIEVDNAARTALLFPSPSGELSWPSGGVGTSIRNLLTLSPGNQHGEYIRLSAGPVTLSVAGGAAQTRILFTPAYQ